MENTQVGPFLILQRLGNRRQKVYRARQTEQNIDVALKFIGMPEEAKRIQAFTKIQIEVDILKKLVHPNLVRTLGAGTEGEQIFFATELVDGESLTTVLSRRGKFAPDQVIDFGRQIARLLDYLHDQDIIHSKLTPDKILIAPGGTVKVADLRLNRSRKRRWDSARKRELEIAAYMAPEQFEEGATAKSDIYSLGVILYEMLTGKLPYEPETMGRMARRKMEHSAPSVAAHVMNCPAWLDRLVSQMIAPDPRRRPHSTKAVVLAFDELKRIDQARTSAVSQVIGGFNVLTAGTDKTEASRILGRKARSREPSTPVVQSVWFLLTGLALVIGILIFALWPVSSEKNYRRAEALMASEEPNDWLVAREYLQKIIARGPAGEWFENAETQYFESRRRTLVLQAERGRLMGLQSPYARKFVEAVGLQMDGKFELAQLEFEELVHSVDPHGDERHIHIESMTRLQQIVEEMASADGQPHGGHEKPADGDQDHVGSPDQSDNPSPPPDQNQ